MEKLIKRMQWNEAGREILTWPSCGSDVLVIGNAKTIFGHLILKPA